MTAASPLARYSAVEGALASGFAIAELHHLRGRDLASKSRMSRLSLMKQHHAERIWTVS